jgi:uncharacterized protein (DUF2252 family)
MTLPSTRGVDVTASTELGSRLRVQVPLGSHADPITGQRADPVEILAAQIPSRLPELIPLRHERMLATPFTFFRGAAAVMAADLAHSPTTGLTVQLCGDAHLSNFGIFASPERRLVFDVNDFDETFPGPWEWDVKRLVASLVVAGRHNGYDDKQVHKIAVRSVRRYQEAMRGFAGATNLAVWYARLDVDELRAQLDDTLDRSTAKRFDKNLAKARGRDHLRSLGRLTEVSDGRRRFVADPPLLVPFSDLVGAEAQPGLHDELRHLIYDYAGGLRPGERELVRSYEFQDMARKVVGVGSVGTRCWVVLMLGRDDNDPLFLQVKEAQASVLAAHLGHPEPRDEGQRVVAGQRIMQAATDIFLGAQHVTGLDGRPRDFYIRQLQDWKGSAQVETMVPRAMRLYGEVCAWTLARAHARSGDRIAIAAYLGDDDTFAEAVASYGEAYADLNVQDHARFGRAVAQDTYLGQGQPV